MRSIAAMAIGAAAAVTAGAAPPQGPVDLYPGAFVARDLTAGEPERLELALTAGEFADLAFPDSSAIIVSAQDAHGIERVRVSRQTTPDGTKRLCILADESGSYGVIVSSSAAGKGVRYVMRVLDRRPATDADRARTEALAALSEGDRESEPATGAGYRRAIPLYERAAARWQAAGDHAEAAMALFRLGYAHFSISEHRPAIDAYLRSADLRHTIGDAKSEAISLNNAGASYYELSNYPASREYYERALVLRRQTGDRDGEAYTISGLGTAAQAIGDFDRALALDLEATAIWRAVGNRAGEAVGLNNTGNTYRLLGDFQAALDSYAGALAIRRELGNRSGMLQTLTAIGAVRLSLGDPRQALAAFDEALLGRSLTSGGRGLAYTLVASANALAELHDWDAAFTRFASATEILRRVGDRDGEARALSSTGRAWLRHGDARRAIELLTAALAIHRETGGRRLVAPVEIALGEAQAKLGAFDVAVQHYTAAADLSRGLRDRHSEMQALTGLAAAERRLGRIEAARDHADAAVSLLESLRAGVASDELRTTYLSTTHRAFELLIELEMELESRHPRSGHAAAALAASERARARGLVDLLSDARVLAGTAGDTELVVRERGLARRAEQAGDRVTRARSDAVPADVADAEREADALDRSLRDVRRELRAASPQYAALTQPPRLELADMQRLLDADTVLVEYALGAERSFVWAVTAHGVTARLLPGRRSLEAAATHAHDLLARGARRETRLQTSRALQAVADLILSPIASALGPSARVSRIVIVADGALQYVPFAALPAPGAASGEPLIARHEVVMLPSATALDALRRGERTLAANALAVFADPVLRHDDPRVESHGPHAIAAASSLPVSRVANAPDGHAAVLDRLPFSRAEARAIAALGPPSSTLEALGFAASREAVLADVGQYRVIHFATHALVDDRHPERSGILLSTLDRSGAPVDGFLRLSDVYHLRLNASLVVLSACRTALGKDVRGEGLVGLTRGFLYAGASAVVASLWDVRDRSTSELMTRFYRGMLRDGLDPASALRAAQIAMWRDPRWSPPANWAGFMLQGDWRPSPVSRP